MRTRDQLSRVEWFGHVVVCTERALCTSVVHGCKQDGRHHLLLARPGLQRVEELKSVHLMLGQQTRITHLWQHDIRDDQIRLELVDLLQGLDTVAGLDNFAEGLKDGADVTSRIKQGCC